MKPDRIPPNRRRRFDAVTGLAYRRPLFRALTLVVLIFAVFVFRAG
jgi:hypothetical protein